MSDERLGVTDLIERVHAAGRRAALVVTGGGAGAAAWLLAVPGASRSVVEVNIPYDSRALGEYLGHAPASACSAATAALLARRARERAAWLDPAADAVGLACTASLRSDRPKKGEHRAHVGVASAGAVGVHSLTLTRDARDRAAEEEVVSRLALNALAAAFGVAGEVALGLLPGEQVRTAREPADLLGAVLAGDLAAVCVEPDGRVRRDGPRPTFLVPGSFNPLHPGHRGMFDAATRRLGPGGPFELSVVNVEKPPLGEAEVRRRLAAFAWYRPLWLTRAPTFVEKASPFAGAVFVVGADTAARIVQPRFYGDSVERTRSALGAIRAAGCRFLVAGRLDPGGRFVCRDDLALEEEFADLFEGIPGSEFRLDVSSSALRSTRQTRDG